jgi:CheY-like chemotaxis protein
VGFFVTKFVRRRDGHDPTHIAQNLHDPLGYITKMQGSPHILIVDDHREIRDLVSRALTKEGFRVSSAPDGRAMCKALADSRIDLILLDLMLPGEDGLSLCRAVRAESNIPTRDCVSLSSVSITILRRPLCGCPAARRACVHPGCGV